MKKLYLYCDSAQEYEELVDCLLDKKIEYKEVPRIIEATKNQKEVVVTLIISRYKLELECRWLYSQSTLPYSVISLSKSTSSKSPMSFNLEFKSAIWFENLVPSLNIGLIVSFNS